MKFKIFFILLLISFTEAFAYNLEKIEPPFWWAGFKSDELQLMLYGENISRVVPEINGSEIIIEKVHKVDSPNYLFIDLKLKNNVPQTFEIEFFYRGEKVFTRDYELKRREASFNREKFLDASDVIYLIMPDRFANGDISNDDVDGLIEKSNRKNKDGRHGGDLQGVIDNLNYIESMGFTHIWLNPVLENNQPDFSYHGYSTTDYYQVDQRFGSNALYKQLSKEAAKRGLGIIKDLVLNHIGSGHWWMDDLPSKDWLNHQNKFVQTNHIHETVYDPYVTDKQRDLFTDGWFVETMPDLNQKNKFVANYLIQVTMWWVEFAGLSSIRVDTYPYVDKKFSSIWSERITKEFPYLNFFGEAWVNDPTLVSYWQSDSKTHDDYLSFIPSMKDFPLQKSLINGLMTNEAWDSGIGEIYRTLSSDFQYGDPYNLVIFPDNHDMQRIFSLLGERMDLYKMALSIILTTRGIPQILYGTEIAMPSTDNHGELRKDFPGGWENDSINAFYDFGLNEIESEAKSFMKTLLNWRKSSDAIGKGKLIHFPVKDGMYIYFRKHEKDLVMVAVNNLDNAKNLDPDLYTDVIGRKKKAIEVLSGKSYSLRKKIIIDPKSAKIFQIK